MSDDFRILKEILYGDRANENVCLKFKFTLLNSGCHFLGISRLLGSSLTEVRKNWYYWL